MVNLETGFKRDYSTNTPILIRAKPVVGNQPVGVLNNRGKFSTTILGDAPLAQSSFSPPNNSGALYLTKAFGTPGVMYKAEWKSCSAFCLTYFQWGPSMWAQQETV